MFSNDGRCVPIYAPGEGILSAHHTSDTATRVLSGTSMATPHVVGVAAVLLGQLGPLYNPGTIRELILGSATLDVITGLRPESHNRLLFSGPIVLPVADFVSGVGRSFRGQLPAVNGVPPYVWSVAGLSGFFRWTVLPLSFQFVGSATASKPSTAILRAEDNARQLAAEVGYGHCDVVDHTVKPGELGGTWDATVSVNCLLLD